ncbi:hypothetical protein THAOC_34373, partial [Thalassiosira oceanica]
RDYHGGTRRIAIVESPASEAHCVVSAGTCIKVKIAKVIQNMGKAKKTRKFAVAKKMISPKDARIKSNQKEQQAKREANAKKEEPRQVEQAHSALFFSTTHSLARRTTFWWTQIS